MSSVAPMGLEAQLSGYSQFMSQLGSMQSGIQQFGSALGTFGAAAAAVGAGTSGMLSPISAAVAATSLLADSLLKVADAATQAVEGIVTTAARSAELSTVNDMLGQRAGFTTSQIDQQTQAIKAQGVELGVAQNLVTQFIRYNLDLSKAQDLARVAQDAAVLSMSNSSETLDRLIWGIQTGQVEILRTAGIQVNLNAAYEQYAAANHKAVAALSTTEKSQATLNAVLAAGVNIQGSYAAAMEEPGKRLRSIPRYINDVEVAVGTPFLGAFGVVVDSLTNFWKTLEKAVGPTQTVRDQVANLGVAGATGAAGVKQVADSFGHLYPVLQTVGAVTQIVAEQISGMASTATTAGIEFLNNFSITMGTVAQNAFSWGVNIVSQLASGIVEGAVAVLNSAMDFVGGLLSYFLAPGSPPKVAPEIDKWGMAAMAEYLHGFTEADFSVLTSMQSTFASVFGVFNKMGLTAGQIGITSEQVTMGLSKILSGIESGAQVDLSFLNQIRSSTAMYGDEVYKLVLDNIQLAEATKQVTDAQNALDAAQAAEKTATDNVSNLTNEYNKMLRAGASKDVLAAKLKEIQVQERQVTISKAQSVDAQKKLDDSKKQQAALQAQAKTQEQLVKQLVDMAKAEADAGEAAKNAADKAADKAAKANKSPKAKASKELPEEFKLPPLDGPLVKPKVDTTVLDNVRKTLGNIFEPMTQAKAKIDAQLNDLSAHWIQFKGIVTGAWNEIWANISPTVSWISTKLSKLIPPDLVETIGKATGGVLTFVGAFALGKLILGTMATVITAVVLPVLSALLSPIGLIIIGVTLLLEAWNNNWFGIRDTLTNVWNGSLKPALEQLGTFLNTTVLPAIKSVAEFIQNNWEPILAGLAAAILTAVVPALVTFASTAIPSLLTAILGLIPAFGAWTASALAAAGATIAALAPVVLPIVLIGAAVGLLVAAWKGNWFGMRDTLTNVWNNTLKPIFTSVWDWLSTNIPAAIASVVGWWNNSFIPALQLVWTWINSNIIPTFMTLWTWLSTNIPAAIAAVSGWWTGILVPALQAVWTWISTYIMPVFKVMSDLLSGVVSAVLGQLSWAWDGVLLPAIQAVWGFITNDLIPLWRAVSDLLDAVVGLAVRVLAAVWENVLLPALTSVWNFIVATLQPVWTALANSFNTIVGVAVTALAAIWNIVLLPALTAIWNFLVGMFKPMWDAIVNTFNNNVIPAVNTATNAVGALLLNALKDIWNFLSKQVQDILKQFTKWITDLGQAIHDFVESKLKIMLDVFTSIHKIIQDIITVIVDLANKIKNMTLPDWMQRHSPSPWEQTLMGASKYLQQLGNTDLPKLHAQLELQPMLPGVSASRVSAAPVSAPSVVSYQATSSQPAQVSFGDVHIHNDMDVAVLKSQIRAVFRESY